VGQRKIIFINGRYLNPAVGRNEVMNFLMINNTVVGVGYLPDDEDATVYDLQAKIVLPNMWAFLSDSGQKLSAQEERSLIQNGFSAVATLEKMDVHQTESGMIYLPHPSLKVFNWHDEPNASKIPEWASIVVNCSSDTQLNVLRAEQSKGRHLQSGFLSEFIPQEWVYSGLKEGLLHFCQPSSVTENVMKALLDEFYHQHEMELDRVVSLVTKGLYVAYGASPKGIALNSQPSFAIFSPTKGSTCDCVVVGGEIRVNTLIPTTDMDSTFKQT